MSNKCEWKDGKFKPCKIHKEILNDIIIVKNPKRLFDDRVIFCPFCGEDIRKPEPEPKQPTHEEILTKWWAIDDDKDVWKKVEAINRHQCSNEGTTYIFRSNNIEGNGVTHDNNNTVSFVKSEWFIGRESADIPPESK